MFSPYKINKHSWPAVGCYLKGEKGLWVPSLFPLFLCKSYISGLTLECGIVGKYYHGALVKTESEIVKF